MFHVNLQGCNTWLLHLKNHPIEIRVQSFEAEPPLFGLPAVDFPGCMFQIGVAGCLLHPQKFSKNAPETRCFFEDDFCFFQWCILRFHVKLLAC